MPAYTLYSTSTVTQTAALEASTEINLVRIMKTPPQPQAVVPVDQLEGVKKRDIKVLVLPTKDCFSKHFIKYLGQMYVFNHQNYHNSS